MKTRIPAMLAVLIMLLVATAPTAQADQPQPTGKLITTEAQAEAIAAACGTFTRETFTNHSHWGVAYKIRYQTNYAQCTGTVINWMQVCVIAGAAYLNAPKMYDIDYRIFNVKTGAYERWYLNAATGGTSTCRTWYANEPVSSLDVNASYGATLNTNLAPDLRVSTSHSL